jgi:hypothetical protein
VELKRKSHAFPATILNMFSQPPTKTIRGGLQKRAHGRLEKLMVYKSENTWTREIGISIITAMHSVVEGEARLHREIR